MVGRPQPRPGWTTKETRTHATAPALEENLAFPNNGGGARSCIHFGPTPPVIVRCGVAARLAHHRTAWGAHSQSDDLDASGRATDHPDGPTPDDQFSLSDELGDCRQGTNRNDLQGRGPDGAT